MKSNYIPSIARLAVAIVLPGTPSALFAQSVAPAAASVSAGGAFAPQGEIGSGTPPATPGETELVANSYGTPYPNPSTMPPGYYARPSRPASALVLGFGHTDEAKQEQLEQDLNVMAFLLERNLERTFGHLPTIKMGIPMLVRDGSRSVQTIYVEGYGAIFLVNVNFPLAGPPEPPKVKEEKPKNSEWESIKQQLYGDPNDASASYAPRGNYSQGPEFNAERVEAVLDELIQSLKNASNLRGVSPDEFVTISVEGSGQAIIGGAGAGQNNFARAGTVALTEGGSMPVGIGQPGQSSAPVLWNDVVKTRTYLSLRAKKSDIEAFAAGEIKLDDFKTRVVKATYRGKHRRDEPRRVGVDYAPSNFNPQSGLR